MDHRPSSQESDPEADLVRRAQRGDRAAFDQLARHYRASLLALAFFRTSNLEAAEDLVQEVLTRAWQKLPTLEEPASFAPWVRTIVANACRSWYRRSPAGTGSLDAESESRTVADRRQQPLEVVLAQERQRLLRRALAAIPEANRLALMMHVWGDYSYKEIARFTGVEVTTVEGRIHRAKRQLRHLLRDEGVGFLGEPRRRVAGKQAYRRRLMSDTTRQDLAQPLALVLFSHQLATLLDSGMSLINSLEILQEAPAPYGDAAQVLRTEVERGGTLSRAMADRPELFSSFYRGMVRAGEVGRVLEETVRRLADVMTKEWKLARGRLRHEESLFLINPGGKPLPHDWADLSDYQRSVTLALFCETLGLLLVSGVPVLQAMEILAELLPPAQREALLAAGEEARRGERITLGLERLGILPRVALELIALGEEAGNLDFTLEKAADILLHELECRMLAG
jgi:RNA polymerase sigma factor (sigma-70 family)